MKFLLSNNPSLNELITTADRHQ